MRIAEVFSFGRTKKRHRVQQRHRITHRRRIEPDARELYRILGWRGWGNVLAGRYRSSQMSFSGEARKEDGRWEFYILNPPDQVFDSQHGACYLERGAGWYWVHFVNRHDIDSGIAAIERHLAEVLGE